MNFHKWTRSAKECYERGCICKGCLINEQMEEKCQMKYTVIDLVKKYGKPPVKIETEFTEQQIRVLDAISKGCNTLAELAIELNKKESAVATTLHVLYKIARGKDRRPKKKGIITKSLLPQFIDFVRKGGFD